MNTAIIQDDYGGFDSTFLGVTLRFWPKSWDLFGRFHAQDRDPEEVIRIGNMALKESVDEAFDTFSIGTVMLHEVRHFHDFILSPYGNHILRLRLLAAVNGVQVIGRLRAKNSVIPVPLPKWRRMQHNERTILAHQWSRVLRREAISFDCDLDPEGTRALVETEKAYGRIKDFVSAPPNETGIVYQPYHLFEGSAIAVQANNVFTVFGIKHSELFLNYLLANKTAYTLPLRAWYALCQRQGQLIDIALLSAAISWSLLGNYSVEGWEACPTTRFAKLFALFEKEGLPRFDRPVASLFERWSEQLSSSPVAESIRDALQRNRELLQKLKALPVEFGDLSQTFGSFIQAQELLSKHFLEATDVYVRPDLYADHVDDLVSAPIRVDFPNDRLIGTREQLEKHLSVRVATGFGNNELAVRRAILRVQTTGRTVIDAMLAADASDLMTLVDFFFAEFRRDEPDFDIARQVSSEQVITMEIL
ncbi:MAG: hypothetical protein QOF41_1486 [Methylobacteriaceae bacterium]|nr:hypothetical protein [Methylobacteriaceae bacterium]